MSHKDTARIWRNVANTARADADNPDLTPARRREAEREARIADRMARKDIRDAYKNGEYDSQ